jgi:hypothetical protein
MKCDYRIYNPFVVRLLLYKSFLLASPKQSKGPFQVITTRRKEVRHRAFPLLLSELNNENTDTPHLSQLVLG